MADLKFALSAAPGITNKIGIKTYYTDAPTAEVESFEYDPPHTSQRQVIRPGYDPKPVIVKIYSTPGFPTVGALLHEFWIDLKNNRIMTEKVWCQVDRGQVDDPISGTDPEEGDTTWNNPYLIGKTVTGFHRQGAGFLVPVEQWTITDGVIETNETIVFGTGEWLMAEISYAQEIVTDGAGTSNPDLLTLTESISLDSAYRNKNIELVPDGGEMTVTLEALTGVSDKTFLTFFYQEGADQQVKILASGSDIIRHQNDDADFIAIGRGETLQLYKKSGVWKVIIEPKGYGILGVQTFSHWKPGDSFPGAMLCDGALKNASGNEWPRIEKAIRSGVAGQIIVTSSVIDSGYTHPAGKEGMFVIHPTLPAFRVPNLMNWHYRALKSNNGETDAERANNYPGGTQLDDLKAHTHELDIDRFDTSQGEDGTGKFTCGGGAPEPSMPVYSTKSTGGTETRGKNAGYYPVVHV